MVAAPTLMPTPHMLSASMPQQNHDNQQQILEKKLGEIKEQEEGRRYAAHAKQRGLQFSALVGIPIDTEALTLLTEAEARESRTAVIERSGKTLVVAVIDADDPKTKKTLDQLRANGFTLKLVATSPAGITMVLHRYETIKTMEVFQVGAVDINEKALTEHQSGIRTIHDLTSKFHGGSATELLEIMLAGALKLEASDIHVEAEEAGARLRYRIDGVLNDVTVINNALYLKGLNRIKILSKLKLNVHRAPQDGRFTIQLSSTEIEVRVSILPSEYGETVVMRLLDPRSALRGVEELGIRPDLLAVITEQLNRSTGAIFTTGPTGSGKTTALYAFLSRLNEPGTKIITIEDPIEYRVQGVSQTQVEPKKGYNFATGLRAIVRQDPDIILVGEIRDGETADIALQAALTGHLVLSTIHTNDAAGTIPRLVDLKVPPQTIAPALNMAMAQRLIRKLCEHCKSKERISPATLEKVKHALDPIRSRLPLPEFNDSVEIYSPKSCDACSNTGYRGRIGVFEAFTMTDEMQKLILKNPPVTEIRNEAARAGMITMLQDAYMKLLRGITSVEEIERVLS